MSDGVAEHPEVVEALRDVSVASRTLKRDQEPEDVAGAVASSAARTRLSSPARPWSSTAGSTSIETLARSTQGAGSTAANRIVYAVDATRPRRPLGRRPRSSGSSPTAPRRRAAAAEVDLDPRRSG